MKIKGKCRAGIRRRKSDSQNAETQECDSWNWPLGLKRQSRARLTLHIRESCEMHEMMKRQSRFGATVNQTTSTQTKGKSRQIKATKAWRKLADVKKEPRETTETDEGNQVSSIQVNQDDPIKSDQIKPNPIKKTIKPASRRRTFGQD